MVPARSALLGSHAWQCSSPASHVWEVFSVKYPVVCQVVSNGGVGRGACSLLLQIQHSGLRRKEAPSSEEGVWNKGQSSFKGHQPAPGYLSLISLACFLQGHWTSEQESAGLGRPMRLSYSVMCLPAASCHRLWSVGPPG